MKTVQAGGQGQGQGTGRVAAGPSAFKKINAIIQAGVLKRVERRLQEIHVPGLSVTKVKGYGEYANFFTPDWLVEHVRIEIFVTSTRADEIVAAILEAAHTGGPGDGIIAVLPVEAVYRVRTGALAASGDVGGSEGLPEPAPRK